MAPTYAAAHITGEYGLDRGDWGSVLGYFGYGYMVGALFGGMLADRYGPRKVWIVAGVTWSVFEIATAWAGDFGLAFLGGSALAASLRHHPHPVRRGRRAGVLHHQQDHRQLATPRERGFVVGFGLLSTPLGALLTAPVAVGLLSLTGSWRAMFYILGGAGLIVLVFFMRIFTDRPETNPRVSPAELREIQSAPPAGRRRPGRGRPRAAVVELLPQQDADAQHAGLFLVHVRELPVVDLDPSTCRTTSATACPRSGTWA